MNRPKDFPREFTTWRKMRERCYKITNHNYKDYGGRGIRICERWRKSFSAFLYDVGRRPKNHTLDRIDNAGHYSCGLCAECKTKGWKTNCKWSNLHTQTRNKRNNVMLTHDGKTQCITDWANEIGLPVVVLWRRIYERHWPVDIALTVKNLKPGQRIRKRR